MAEDGDTPTPQNARAMLTKSRMEALSDGVLGFSTTLLVADLALRPPGAPLHQFLAAWPAYLAYLTSFLTIGAGWIAHNALTDGLDRVDRVFLRLNLIFLMLVAFLPFPTHLVGEGVYGNLGAERVATVVYGISLLAIRLVFFVLAGYGSARHLRRSNAEDADMRETRSKFGIVVAGYVATILLSLFFPTAAVVVYLVIALYLFVPLRTVIRELSEIRGRRVS